jgi:peptidoglycan hydrolase CwlO-like protein
MWSFIYLVIFTCLLILFSHCLVEMIYSKQNKSSIKYFCILFLVALALSHFYFSTNEESIFNIRRLPLPYQQSINFQSVEGFDGSGSGGSNDSGTTCSPMTITDKNVFLLNDRVNALDSNYQTLDTTVKNLQTQVEELMNQTTDSAADAVGTEPYNFSSDGNLPETTPSMEDSGSGSGSGGK